MPITITTISVRDNLGKLHTALNSNFSALKDGIELLEAKLNPTTGNLAVSNATFQKGARSISTEIVTNEASERIKGNFTVEGTTTLDDLTISNAAVVNMNSAKLSMLGAASEFTAEGIARFDGPIILKDYAASSIDASEVSSFVSVSSNIGTLDISGTHAMILDFSNYSASANVLNTNDVKDVIIQPGTYQGQSLSLIINASASTGKPHKIKSNNIASLSASQSIEFQEDYGFLDLVYVGSNWVIKNIFKGNIA